MRSHVGAMSRRDIMSIAAFGACALVVGVGEASATPEVVAADMKKLYGDKKATPGKVCSTL